MGLVKLQKKRADGRLLEASFLPEIGLNLVSYTLEGIEVIDQNTKQQFEERRAGLGPLIGPHFHRRKKEVIPKIPDESKFSHLAAVQAKGIEDPFSHGISRYAPWDIQAAENTIRGELSGKKEWNGVTLSTLEGQNFKMNFEASLLEEGLKLDLSVVSDTDSVVGIHYYYHLFNRKGRIVSRVKNQMIDKGQLIEIPEKWYDPQSKMLNFKLDEEADFTFYPYPDPLHGMIDLYTEEYHLKTKYWCISQENCWQFYHPKDSTFVCIEPLSAQDPRHPNLTVSSISILLEIELPEENYEL